MSEALWGRGRRVGWVRERAVASRSLGPLRMNAIHFPTNSSTSIPIEAPPSLFWMARRAVRSPAVTRRRESRVASEVCLTPAKSWFAFSKVALRPSDVDARYSLRESNYG